MARKKKDLKAAKAAKQKKIAIGGAVLLLGLLAFSVPKTLKMLHPQKQAASQSKRASSQSTPGTASTPGTTMSPTNTFVPSIPVSNVAPVLTAQLAPAAREGQLSVLSASFKSKDPFRQLIDEDASSASSTDTSTAAEPASNDPSLKVVPSSEPATTTAAAPATPAAPAAPDVRKITLPLLSAVISVNGDRQGVDVKLDFPTEAPLFHLISLTRTTAKISVAGGSLESGKATLILRRGKPLTLVNTADGTRFRLVLRSTSTSAAAKPPPTVPAPGAEPAAPATTTPTTTTQTPTIGG